MDEFAILSVPQTLTNIAEIRQRLLETEQLSKALDEQIAAACVDTGRLHFLDDDIVKTVVELDKAAPGIHSTATSTVAEAERIISKTRQLDAAHARVQQALEHVEDILDLKSCISGVQTALQHGNLHMAAMHVKRFRSVQALVRVLDEDREVMQRAEQQLASLVEASFQAAILANDMDAVKTCCQLTNILGKAEKGLDRYLTFLCQQLIGELAEEKRRASGMGSPADPAFTVNLASAMFARGVKLLQEAEVVAANNFGSESGSARVIAAINEVCDKQASDVILAFLRSDRIKQVIDAAGKPLLTGAPEAVLMQRRTTDALLSEIALTIQRCVTYMRLIRSKAESIDAAEFAVSSPTGAPREPRLSAVQLIQSKCELQKALAEVAGVYANLEERFLRDGLRMAAQADERLGDSFTSSLVEESFYVLQQCSQRALATGSADCVCGLLNHVVGLLDTALVTELGNRFETSATVCGSNSVTLERGKELSAEFIQLCICCNNIELCESYSAQFSEALRAEALSSFAGDARQGPMVTSCLDDLAGVAEKAKRMNQASSTRLVGLLTPRLRSALNVFSGASSLVQYELSEQEYASRQTFDLFANEFLQRLDDLVTPFKACLSTELHVSFVTKVAVHVAKNLETQLMRKKFNHIGAVQFEKDIRSLVSFFCDRSTTSVKAKLMRLTQLSRMVSLESPAELLEYWGANEGPVPWEFNASEAKRVLSLRQDFSPETIASLPL